jgi:transcriptional regulator with XRE-family HTH domain
MKTTIHQQLVTGLAQFKGKHAQIARESGIAQATISRVARGECSPTLAIAQPIFDWMEKNSGINAVGIVPATPRVREKRKKQDANSGGLKNLGPAVAVHG